MDMATVRFQEDVLYKLETLINVMTDLNNTLLGFSEPESQPYRTYQGNITKTITITDGE